MGKTVYLGPVLTLLLLLVLIYAIISVGIPQLIINSIIGIVILLLANLAPQLNIKLNLWNILIVALGGILGAILVIVLHLGGVEI